jgi:hypothetical protein
MNGESKTNEKRMRGRRRTLIEVSILALAFILIWAFWNVAAAFVVVVFCAMLIWRVDARIPLALAVVLLVTVPFLLVLNQQSAGDKIAELSYFFLAVGVFLLLVEHLRIAWKAKGKPEELAEMDEDPSDQSRVT